MATRTRTPSPKTPRTSSAKRGNATAGAKPRAAAKPRAESAEREPSAFAFGNSGGALFGAALAGAAIGFAANYGRKFLMQGMEATAGDWDAILAAEHEAALAIFDKMLATDASQTFKRKMLLMKLTHAIDKHAHQEEMVVYPALREANQARDADLLEGEHGQVKTFLYELGRMSPDAPNWLEKVREFRSAIAAHMRMEEEQVFPAFKQAMTEGQTRKITALVNRDGFWMA
ncbi:hemerythrin domain-containing protein [Sphingomonas sp.]|uniref:hemerythrin domain-containing protein n=1 Tax=Sphingomonas sp. TaxID=28214 RepID=UPI00286E0370|nr:hemerythrin domain-containing protein [Sphingomonas sp.]